MKKYITSANIGSTIMGNYTKEFFKNLHNTGLDYYTAMLIVPLLIRRLLSALTNV